MAVSFNKEVIAEAIQEILAEDGVTQMFVTSKNKMDIKSAMKKKGVTDVSAVDQAKPGDVVAVEEDHHENPNDDSDMAKSQLYAIAKYAVELLQMIKDGDPLDAWVQAKITKASDYIDAVQHYLEGEEYLDTNQEVPNEEPVRDLDEIKAGEFAKIKKGTKIGMKGYGYVTVLDNDGIVLTVKDQFGEIFPINLGQYNEKAL